MSTVSAFHDAVATLLRAHPDAAAEGPLATSAVYNNFVFRQKESLAAGLLGPVKVAWETQGGRFRDLVFAFAQAHPPQHWDPNMFLEPFAGFLSERRAAEGATRFPAYLEEIADLCFLRYRVMLSDFGPGVGLDETLFVRHYHHDVIGFVREVDEAKGTATFPSAGEQTVVVCRSRSDQRRREFVATPADMSALAVRLGLAPTSTPEDTRQAEIALCKAGVLA